jgi:hypothetical protein
MQLSKRRSLAWISVVALTLGMVLSSCGMTPAAVRTTRVAATDTPAAAATAVPSATATLSAADIAQISGCPALGSSAEQHYLAVGGLRVSTPDRQLDYASELMPSPASNAPYQLATGAVNNFSPNPPVNPSLLPGYFFQFCNVSSVAQTLSGISVNIASFTASSGPVAVWRQCQDSPYDAATKQAGGGCGGGVDGLQLAATLPSDNAGTSAPVTGVGWPVIIGPNEYIVILVGVHGLTGQGMYTLSFTISANGATPASVMPSDGAFLMAPSAVVWSGTACQTPAMQALIPPSSQDTYYVCPPSS